MISRRRFWSYAAPAIVLAPSLMRVSAAALESLPPVSGSTWYQGYGAISFSELVSQTLRSHSAEIWKSVESRNALLASLRERTPQPS